VPKVIIVDGVVRKYIESALKADARLMKKHINESIFINRLFIKI